MKVKINRSGSIFIGATIFLGVAAANTGNNLLYIVVSSMLAMMLISGISSILNIKGIEVRLIPPPEVYAGSKSSFRVIVRKRFSLPSFLVKISSVVDEIIFPLIDAKWRENKLDFLFLKRGRVDKVSINLSSDFPLGMFVRFVEVELNLSFVVFPKPIPANFVLDSSEKEDRGIADRAVIKGYEEVKSIRKYAGEPMKLVHWKVSAKKGKLMVKEMVEEEERSVVLSLDMVDGDIETRLSKLTFMVLRLMDEGCSVGLKLKDREIPPGRGDHHKRLLLRELALY